MVNPRENEDELTMLRKALEEIFEETFNEETFEDMKNDEEDFLHPMQRYEIRFSTSKPKKKFLLMVRTPLRLEEMPDKAVKDILQGWINDSFETPYKVKKIFSIENL